MSFIVQKSLGNSFFRFAVSRRRELRSIDPDAELSTGSSGEFVRHRPEIFYSADLRTIHKPEMPQARSISGTPFWSTIFDGTPRSWGMIAMMAFGGLLVLIGLAVMKNNRVPGIMEVLVGLVLIAIPIFFAWQKRSAIKRAEDRVRKEREERDRRNAELLGAYTSALEKLRDTPDDATLDHVRRENEKLDLPYAVWADTAIGTVLYVGFSTLARVGPERAEEVAKLMDRSSDAAGLIAEDAIAVKHALYSTVLWHLVADDRLGQSQLGIVRQIQAGFGIDPEDVPNDTAAEAQFERLRGIDHRNAPRCETQVPLSLNEYCMYTSPVKTTDGNDSTVSVTSKRFLFGADQKKVEVPVAKVDDILVDADRNKVVIQASELKRPLEFHAEEPIYLAAMVDLATRLDDRPKSFT
ncbi:MAG TPA: hypothetical protein VEK11_21265 [Thermoanaerobaculia bacterium]|jgi:hypothetical protein|nr:hypothetical protein [Thermoanaerobaculia bacterium]